MSKAIAIAVPTPFKAAYDSAVNSAKLVLDFMYGTQQRADMTMLFALGAAAASMVMQYTANTVLPYCVN